MEKLTPVQKKEIIDKLKSKFDTGNIEYIGYNRFVLRVPIEVQADTGQTITLPKDKLFNENCEEIPLQNDYFNIFNYTAGVAIVCIRKNFQINDRSFSEVKKVGLIDINGKELLPCIYDFINPHLDGFIEITKDGIKKATNVNVITDGKFNWDEAINWDH